MIRQIIDNSPNYSKKNRLKKQIKYVVMHYTGMQSEIESIKRLKDPKFEVSCHYLINRRGQIISMVPENKIAWHAGKSKWSKFKNLNKFSIGIELVNRGKRFGYQNYTYLQIRSLISLCRKLKKKYNIKKEDFLGHSDIAPLRKIDPGEKFPWKKLSKYQIGLWYKSVKLNHKFIMFNKIEMRRKFFKNLYKIGYRYFTLNKSKKTDALLIKAFQRRYVPNNINGRLDEKTVKISHFLAHNYK
tara:strand:- start:160 stop:888 length:729 start_codon:yes stop_codon:yes gene_type:complete